MKKMKQQRKERKKPKNEVSRMPLPNLPNEIKDKILLSLPMRNLLEFRCVIRDYSRFHNPHFIKMHLNQQMEIHSPKFILTTASKIYEVNSDDLRKPQLPGFPFWSPFTPINLDFPFKNPTCASPIKLAGSCNGLVCLSHRGLFGSIVYLWNPATGEYKQLPPNNLDRGGIFSLGFGYDHISGKFKVLVISDLEKRKIGFHKVEATVYTLGTGSWRSIGEIQYSLWQSRPQVFDGSPHWIVGRLKAVVWFSIGDEKFKEIPLPPSECNVPDFALTALGGRLSLFSYVYTLKRHELWVRINDGLENTWTKQLCFNLSVLDIDGRGFLKHLKPLGFRNGHVLVQDTLYRGPIFFDPVTNTFRQLYIRGEPRDFLVYPYIESLAMLTVEDRGVVQQNFIME